MRALNAHRRIDREQHEILFLLASERFRPTALGAAEELFRATSLAPPPVAATEFLRARLGPRADERVSLNEDLAFAFPDVPDAILELCPRMRHSDASPWGEADVTFRHIDLSRSVYDEAVFAREFAQRMSDFEQRTKE
jgi:hypothetical protein